MQIHYANYIIPQLQLHYVTTTAALHHTTSSSCGPGDHCNHCNILQPLQKTQLQPPIGPSVDSLCHPWLTATNLSYRFSILKLPPPPCAALLVRVIEVRIQSVLWAGTYLGQICCKASGGPVIASGRAVHELSDAHCVFCMFDGNIKQHSNSLRNQKDWFCIIFLGALLHAASLHCFRLRLRCTWACSEKIQARRLGHWYGPIHFEDGKIMKHEWKCMEMACKGVEARSSLLRAITTQATSLRAQIFSCCQAKWQVVFWCRG